MATLRDSSLLLDQAASKREQARRCRVLAADMGDSAAAGFLHDYALELEERAEALELLAGDSRDRVRPETWRRQA
jgi:hypothetical protein